MSYKWIGALCIVGSCGGFGISLAVQQRNEEKLLCQLRAVLDEMLWELPYRLTPLPELLRHSAKGRKGILPEVLLELAEQLDRQVLPDALSCMHAAIGRAVLSFPRLHQLLLLLGHSLGRFDLSGQLQELTALREQCDGEIQELRLGRSDRLKSYRVLGLCAGAALVILLL
ncbi:MAG: stage III sporulation protein AB [Candidatus Faecousia sp.]|nr:stage III sporulation protein AB [Candidatus Faecousia sp.]